SLSHCGIAEKECPDWTIVLATDTGEDGKLISPKPKEYPSEGTIKSTTEEWVDPGMQNLSDANLELET
ncbi:hypothetical protein EWB00_000550, partial [Schistosoma japonicum]